MSLLQQKLLKKLLPLLTLHNRTDSLNSSQEGSDLQANGVETD